MEDVSFNMPSTANGTTAQPNRKKSHPAAIPGMEKQSA
jgi:hypothetical protein